MNYDCYKKCVIIRLLIIYMYKIIRFSIFSIHNQQIEDEKRELAAKMELSRLLEESKKQLKLEEKIKKGRIKGAVFN